MDGSPCCILSVPTNRPAFFAKAIGCTADTLMLDLEDAVFPDQKEAARRQAMAALADLDWGRKRLLVRVNALDTQWGVDDFTVLASVRRLDGFMVPKVESADDMAVLQRLLERPLAGRDTPPELHILVETALGVANVERILRTAPWLRSVTFGAGDYARSVSDWSGLVSSTSSRATPPLQLWAKARVANAAHVHGVTPIDGPSPHISDTAAARRAAEESREGGFLGKWAIHPTQVPDIRALFAPSPEAIAWARRALVVLDEVEASGKGAAKLDGRLLEAAHRGIALRILAEAKSMEER